MRKITVELTEDEFNAINPTSLLVETKYSKSMWEKMTRAWEGDDGSVKLSDRAEKFMEDLLDRDVTEQGIKKHNYKQFYSEELNLAVILKRIVRTLQSEIDRECGFETDSQKVYDAMGRKS